MLSVTFESCAPNREGFFSQHALLTESETVTSFPEDSMFFLLQDKINSELINIDKNNIELI